MGAPVNFSLKKFIEPAELIDKIKQTMPRAGVSSDVTAWMDLTRTCRQPQVFWAVDYIEARKDLISINQIIKEAESILFDNVFGGDDIVLKPGYTAEINQLASFNTIRAHLLAENGLVDRSVKMFKSMLTVHFDNLSVIRQSNLLFHCCLAFLCTHRFRESYECFEKHWGLTKYATLSIRTGEGLSDNQTILQMIYWFFIKHVEEFRDFYAVTNQQPISDIWNHKKIALLHFLEYDCAWVASFCSISFYNHARTLFPTLPKYEKKPSTPDNFNKLWMDDTVTSYAVDFIDKSEEKKYFELYNKEISQISTLPDLDKSDDYLYSYYHYKSTYTKELNDKMLLLQYVRSFIDNKFYSVLEAGCSCQPALGFAGKDYTAVDISSKVCEVLRDKNIRCYHECISKFISRIDQQFDLCFAYDILNHLNHHRLETFLGHCSRKCKYLAVMIDMSDDLREDILSPINGSSPINLHRIAYDYDGWVNCFKTYFSETHFQVNDSNTIYAFCKS